MKEIIVTGNYKVTRFYFALLGILGVLILTGYVYSYLYIEIHAGSFSVIVMGLLFAIGVTLYGFGLSKLPIPEIVISDEGIRCNNSAWNSTIKWEKIKK